jgi:hypothetical protein
MPADRGGRRLAEGLDDGEHRRVDEADAHVDVLLENVPNWWTVRPPVESPVLTFRPTVANFGAP